MYLGKYIQIHIQNFMIYWFNMHMKRLREIDRNFALYVICNWHWRDYPCTWLLLPWCYWKQMSKTNVFWLPLKRGTRPRLYEKILGLPVSVKVSRLYLRRNLFWMEPNAGRNSSRIRAQTAKSITLSSINWLWITAHRKMK